MSEKKSEENLGQGSYPGVFIAAKNIINHGQISSHANSKIHIQTENYEGTGKVVLGDIKTTETFLQRFLWQIVGGLIITVIGGVLVYVITEGQTPKIIENAAVSMATSSPNLNAIFKKKDSYSNSLDKQNFIQNYQNTFIYGEGDIQDYNKNDTGYIVYMRVENNETVCLFGSNYNKDILLLQPGNSIKFSGVFTTSGYGYYQGVSPWTIENCTLE
jgi:hypothetical protein